MDDQSVIILFKSVISVKSVVLIVEFSKPQTDQIDALLANGDAGFLAIYGRRRVGKTFLIREYQKRHLAFELTGMLDSPLADQPV